jgi:hypothetical protein
MENKRQFVGDGKQVQGYPLVNFSVCLSDLPADAVYEGKNSGKKYINLTIGQRKDGEDQYGKTHSVWVDDFKPEAQEQSASAPAPARQTADLPF